MAQDKAKRNHRDRKNPRSAEAYQKQRHEQNSQRPKQERIYSILEVGNSRIEKIIGPFRD